MRLLRLEHHTGIQLIVIADHAEHHVNLMSIILVFREAALVLVVVRRVCSHRIRYQRQIVVETAIDGYDSAEDVTERTVGICRTVTLVIAILVLIAELQVCAQGYRLAVGRLDTIAPVFRRRQVIPVGKLRHIATGHHHFIVIHLRERQALAVLVAIAEVTAQGHVSAVAAQAAVNLQHGTTRRIGISTQRTGSVLVYHDAVSHQLLNGNQRVGHKEVRILVEGGRYVVSRVSAAIAVGYAQRRTEHNVRSRVRTPLQAHLGIPVVRTAKVLTEAVRELLRTEVLGC